MLSCRLLPLTYREVTLLGWGLLVRGFRAWCKPSLLLGFQHSDVLGFWPCSPYGQEHLWDQEMRGPPGTETPQRTGAHSWRWGPTLEQCNTACGFLNCYMETESSAPQILKERAASRGEGGDSETPKYTFQRMETCLHERLKDKLGHGELLDMVLARSLLGSKECSESYGRGGL